MFFLGSLYHTDVTVPEPGDCLSRLSSCVGDKKDSGIILYAAPLDLENIGTLLPFISTACTHKGLALVPRLTPIY